MNVYEHGIAALKDEWGGSLSLVATTDLPIYSGFQRTIVDLEGHSLNERAVHLGLVNGAHFTMDYWEENDLRYCVLATLYHLDRLIVLYVTLTQLFEETYPPGTAISGNTNEPRVFYELDAFLGAARRVYEAIRKVLWKHYSNGAVGRWRSITGALNSDIVPPNFSAQLRKSWESFGEKLKEYRDCVAHYDPLTEEGTTCWMGWYGSRWGMTVRLPSNPRHSSRRSYDFTTGPEALSYCHTVMCHLVDLCEALEAEERIRDYLDNPRKGKPREN